MEVFLHHLDAPSEQALTAVLDVTRSLAGAREVSWTPSDETSSASGGNHPFANRTSVTAPGTGTGHAPADVRLSAPVLVDGVVRGVVEVFPGPGGIPDLELPGRSAVCVAGLLRTVLVQAESDRWDEARQEAQSAVRQGRSDLAEAELRERSRLATTVLDRTGRMIDAFTDALEALRVSGALEDLTAARSAVEALTATFRSLARGVHPLQLRTNGPGAALSEVAHELGRTLTRLGGPLRSSWEVETGLFWAAVGVLRGTAHWPLTGPVLLRWASAGGRITTDMILDTRADEITAADRAILVELLHPDVRRLEALGGGATVAVRDNATVVTCWLPESLGGSTTFRREPWRSP